MQRVLKISNDFTMPLDTVTETLGVFGIRGSGKSTVGVDIAEELLKAGLPIVAYDPMSVWRGLKTSADGKHPGFPVIIFGGEHPDVPLNVKAAETVARVIIEKRLPAILDCSVLSNDDRIRFMDRFLRYLYHKNRLPLHVFIDEAHTVAPQNTRKQAELSQLIGAIETISLQGRIHGLGMTVISPRPALVNSTIRNLCSTLIAMRTIGPHDINAIKDWTDAHGSEDEAAALVKALPTLKNGEGFVWSPTFLGFFGKVKFRMAETFDSRATPKVGQVICEQKVLAAVDIAALGSEIAAAAEQLKANDPAELHATIAGLRKQLAAKDVVKAAPAPIVEPTIVKVPVLQPDEIERIEKMADIFQKSTDRLSEALKAMQNTISALKHAPASPKVHYNSSTFKHPVDVPALQPTVNKTAQGDGDKYLAKGERAVLICIAENGGEAGVGRQEITVVTGYKRSTRDAYISRLLLKNYITQNDDRLLVTQAGINALGNNYQPLPTGSYLLAKRLADLPDGESKILSVLAGVYPLKLSRDSISEQTGYKRSTRDAYIGRLAARKLVTASSGSVQASSLLFD